jgi:NhaP-type Na+/H+ or K+/H+ antiporter
MPLFPLLLQSNDPKTPPARAAAIAVAFVVLSSLFVGGSSASIFAHLVAGI